MAASTKRDSTKKLRINMIIDLINKKTPYGGVTKKELVKEFEVSEKTIERDLNTIQNDFGVPLIRQERVINGVKRTFYNLEAGYLPSLSPEKATVVFLSLLQQKGSALAGHLNELKDVLVSTLFKYHYNPKELAVDRLQNRIHLVEETLAEPKQVGERFSKLIQALKEGYQVKIYYFVGYKQEESRRVVEPYGLICKRQNWYLVAYCLERKGIRVFRVDQIKNVIPYTSEKFNYPEDFNLKEYMANSWGVINDEKVCRVKLKFSPRVSYRVKNVIYHPSQAVEKELEDGSVIITYNVCGIEEMKTWIIQWGNNVEVLEPSWLRQEMCEMAEDIIKLYR